MEPQFDNAMVQKAHWPSSSVSSTSATAAGRCCLARRSTRRQAKRNNDDESEESQGTKKPRLVVHGKDSGDGGQKLRSKSKGTSNQGSNNEIEDMNWVCAECKEAECLMEPSADQFLLCDGDCNRVFHYPCAGLSQLPSEDEDWVCKDCTQSRHQCSFCHEYGQDGLDVFACNKEKCGLFYHESCLALNNVPVKMEQALSRNASPRSVEADSPQLLGSGNVAVSLPFFTCPAHHCWTCTQEGDRKKEQQEEQQERKESGRKTKRGKKKKKTSSTIYQCKTEGRIYRCLHCPWSYHLTCLPPTSKFHELAILCPEHSLTQKLPDLDLANSLQNSVENKIDRTIMKLSGQSSVRRRLLSGLGGRGSASSNPFFPGIRGDRLMTAETQYRDYLGKTEEDNVETDRMDVTSDAIFGASSVGGLPFCLPADIKNEVHSKPPTYSHIHGLRYDSNNRPKKSLPTGEQCQCSERCDDQCFNRMALVECCGEGPSSNCRLGVAKCGNRSLGKRQFVKCKPKRETGKGWGLMTLESVPKGKLVHEYVGEVINEAEKERRLVEWSREHPNDPNFYIMGLGIGWFVDARECANMSRFINHSCDPNCQVTTINVRGYKRNGIFAIRDINAGEFLSYDYHFDTKQADKFLCRCGAKKCRGTMQGGAGAAEAKKPLSWREAKARYENDMKQLSELNAKQVTSQVGALIPAAEQPTEFVASGPPEKYRDTVLCNRIFLWRNTKGGSDFVSRMSRVDNASSEAPVHHICGPSRKATDEVDIS